MEDIVRLTRHLCNKCEAEILFTTPPALKVLPVMWEPVKPQATIQVTLKVFQIIKFKKISEKNYLFLKKRTLLSAHLMIVIIVLLTEVRDSFYCSQPPIKRQGGQFRAATY